jgi:SAM-dependent methyltransferase
MSDPWDVAGWNRAYEEGDTPWHSDDPHREVVRVAEEGIWRPGRILDVGCGRGSNLIWLAGRGFEGWGVDVSEEAIRQARARAPAGVRLSVLGSLEIGALGEGLFDYVLDMGCYHLHEFTPELRPLHAAAIHSALRPGGELLLICFSPREPAEWGGPRRVPREELDEVFGPLFELADIRESQWRATTESEGPWSWVARWKKLEQLSQA